MRIGIDASSTIPPRTGIGNYTYNLLQALGRIDKENEYILYFNYFRPSKIIPKFEQPNFEKVINRIPCRVQRVLHNNLKLPIELFVGKIDVFHSPNYFLPPTRGAKGIITIHDITFKRFPETQTRSDTRYANKWVPEALKMANGIITDSQSAKRDIIELLGVPENKIDVIYGAVDQRFLPINDIQILQEVKMKYNLPEKFLLYVGTLEPRKNISGLLQAFAILRQNISYKLVIAGGKGWLYDEIFEIVRKLNLTEDVIFAGYVPDEDLPAFYNLADLFVFPSLYEGFGLPPLEAMACGVPVVCSNTSSLPEVAGDVAIMVDPYDVEGLAEAMHKILADVTLQQKMRAKGLKRAKLFSWEEAAKKTLAVYRKVTSS